VSLENAGIRLAWEPNAEPDLAGYAIHRSTTADFNPSPGNLYRTQSGTAHVDRWVYPMDPRHYLVSAYDADIHGGGYSIEAVATALPWQGEGEIVDVGAPGSNSILNGNVANGFFGAALAVGDLNGDGTKDLIVGAPGEGTGRVHVFFGGPGFDPTDPSATIHAPRPNEEFGWVLATGDVDGDGIDDLVIGAAEASPLGRSGAGEVFVLLGSASFASRDLDATPADLTPSCR
jgi:hypothetical protein